jgi:hypothetical protein
MPKLEDFGFEPRKQLQSSLASDNESERRKAFNLLETLINDGYDLNKVKDILFAYLVPSRLTAQESLLVIELIDEWVGKTKSQQMDLVTQILSPFIFESSQQVQTKALTSLIKLDDEMFLEKSWHRNGQPKHIITTELARRLFDEQSRLSVGLDTVNKIKLYRKFLEMSLINEAEAAGRIASLSLPDESEGVLEEINNWGERTSPFTGILRGLLASEKAKSYTKSQAIELLGKNTEGRKIIMDAIRAKSIKDNSVYLDALSVLIKGNETKTVAVSLLNDLPVSFFENEELFIHIAHHGLAERLLKYHKASEIAIMVRCLGDLRVGDMITRALDNYFVQAGRQRTNPPKPRFGHSGNDVDWRFIEAQKAIQSGDTKGAVSHVKEAIRLLREVDFDELDSSGFPVADMINQGEVALWVLGQLQANNLADSETLELLQQLKAGKNGLELKQVLGYKSSSPIERNDDRKSPLGGIDFRGMSIITQPVNTCPINLNTPLFCPLDTVNFNREFQEIQNMLSAGIIPSTQRIKECIQACCQKKRLDRERGKMRGCIADTMRLEEDQAVVTNSDLKDLLALLESSKSTDELQSMLNNISVSSQEVELIQP